MQEVDVADVDLVIMGQKYVRMYYLQGVVEVEMMDVMGIEGEAEVKCQTEREINPLKNHQINKLVVDLGQSSNIT